MSKTEFKLKDYTTIISADQSILEIERMLVSCGASHIMKEYSGDGKILLISFRLNGIAFKIPSNWSGVYNKLYGMMKRCSARDAMANREAQAYRVAWRIVRDYIFAQLSMVMSEQAIPEQLMFGYAYNGKSTIFQVWIDDQKKLPAPKEEQQ
jgi:hypothetical protein